ncbi:MAG: MBL fold metallo-hydrolase [Phycisphaeraceae bacterium]|nr:MBL fold metallo-hydrolase [Phycisphaeraceae bacterium]
MNQQRRDLLRLTAGLAGLGLVGGPAVAAATASGARVTRRSGDRDRYFTWEQPGGNDRPIWVAVGEGGNSLVLVGEDESLVVDCKTAAFGAALLREANSLSSRAPVKTVINTHHHADHTGGNYAMIAAGLPVISHAKCAKRVASGENRDRYAPHVEAAIRALAKSDSETAKAIMAEAESLAAKIQDLPPAAFAPTKTITENTEMEAASERLLLQHAGNGHTDNDVFVFIPRLNVLHTGDLLFARSHPFIDRAAGASTTGWCDAVRRMITLCDSETIVVPGHGDVTDLEGLKAQIVYFDTVRDGVSKMIDAGKSRDDVTRSELEAYADYARPQLRPAAFGAVYDEIIEERQRDEGH